MSCTTVKTPFGGIMRFSVILPLHNVAPWLPMCLDSLCQQSWQNWEGLCIDDGSIDQTGELITQRLRTDLRIRAIFQPPSGVSNARNRALHRAQGDIICFLDGDDAVAPWWLDEAHRLFNQTQADALCFGCPQRRMPPIAFASPKTTIQVLQGPTAIQAWGWPNFFRGSYCVRLLLRKALADCVTFPAVPFKEDTLYDFALLPHIHRLCVTPSVHYFYRIREGALVGGRHPFSYPSNILKTLPRLPLPPKTSHRRILATFGFCAVVDWLYKPQAFCVSSLRRLRTEWIQTANALKVSPRTGVLPHWIFAATLFTIFGWRWPTIVSVRLLRLYGSLRARIYHE